MLLNQEGKIHQKQNFKLWNHFTYLGIQIVPTLSNIIETNYRPAVQEVFKFVTQMGSFTNGENKYSQDECTS